MDNTIKTTHLFSVLCSNLCREQSEYRAMLLSHPAPYILNHAQEYVVREKIVACIRLDILTTEQINALLSEERPLEMIYERVSAGELVAIDQLIGAIFEEADACINAALVLEALDMVDPFEDEK